MALVATAATLKAKLTEKGKLRPHDMTRKKMPDGAAFVEELPRRAPRAAEGSV